MVLQGRYVEIERGAGGLASDFIGRWLSESVLRA